MMDTGKKGGELMQDEMLEDIAGGYVVDGGDGKFWLVRQNGTVISPVPEEKMGQDFAKAYGVSADVISKEDYAKRFGRELEW